MRRGGAERFQDQAATYQRLLVGGRPGRATVGAVRETGSDPAGDPEVELDLHVVVDGWDYLLTHRQIVSRVARGELRAGAELPVRVDRLNPSILVIA